MRFDQKLQKLRKASGMNQEALADKLNVSRQAVSKWESGASYPETDKLIQMSKIFNCTLDELVNDSDTDKSIINNSVKKKNMYLDSFIEFIAKSVNMFSSMKFWDLIKALIELIIIALILVGISAIVWIIGGTVINDIIFGFYIENEFLWNIVAFIRNLILGCYFAVIASIDFIIYLQIYKIRYLDYYDKLVYEYDQKKRNEEVVETEKINDVVIDEVKEEKIESKKQDRIKLDKKKEDKIVIRDPNHRPFAFLSPIAKFIVALFKLFLGFIGALFVGSLIFFVISFVVSIYLATLNDMFGGVIIGLFGVIVFNILIIELIYKAITSIKVNFKRVLIQSLICIIISSIGAGIFIVSLKDIDFIEYGDNNYYVENIESVKFDNEVNVLDISELHYGNSVLVVDEKLSDTLEIKISYNKDLTEYKYEVIDNRIILDTEYKVDTIKKAADYTLNNLKNNKIMLFDLYDVPFVEIKGSREDIESIVKYLRDREDVIYTDQNQDGIYHSW